MTTITNVIVQAFARIREEEKGQGLVEYALILALVSIAAIATLALVGTNVDGVLNTVEAALPG